MKRQAGYTLIEVIIAFAMLALALGVLLGALSRATQQVRRSEWVTRAALHAQSFFALQGTSSPIRQKDQRGTFENGVFQWALRAHRYQEPELVEKRSAQEQNGPQLIEYVLDVRWGDTAQDHLVWRTLRYTQPTSSEQLP